MMADKVQALFTTLSLRLFKTNKTDGEIKPDFEIDGRQTIPEPFYQRAFGLDWNLGRVEPTIRNHSAVHGG
ncbi:hypothetical protein [Paenibacillus larvae]|uniref:hypothetical protein n=1 Tax=Paenibacillus larvae TaxID=1464 RepID=UPI0028929194|nr:hypothetical protein [Paenibacillus larvae]MDT2191041.1 hypothetical protein [Paenibacillus larvae]